MAFGVADHGVRFIQREAHGLAVRDFVQQSEFLEAVIVGHPEFKRDLFEHGHFAVAAGKLNSDFRRAVAVDGDRVTRIVLAGLLLQIDQLYIVLIASRHLEGRGPKGVRAFFQGNSSPAGEHHFRAREFLVHPKRHVDPAALNGRHVPAVGHLPGRPLQVFGKRVQHVDRRDFGGRPRSQLEGGRTFSAELHVVFDIGLYIGEEVHIDVFRRTALHFADLPVPVADAPTKADLVIQFVRANPHHLVVAAADAGVSRLDRERQRRAPRQLRRDDADGRHPEAAKQNHDARRQGQQHGCHRSRRKHGRHIENIRERRLADEGGGLFDELSNDPNRIVFMSARAKLHRADDAVLQFRVAFVDEQGYLLYRDG